jgi:hypothetical protein
MPWAASIDRDHAVWLHGEFPIRDRPGGSVQLHVRRETDGYHAVNHDPHLRRTVGASRAEGGDRIAATSFR